MPHLYVGMNVAFACRFCMSILHVIMHVRLRVLKKYPLRGCYSEWGKQPYGVLSPSPNLPLKERWGVSLSAESDKGSALDLPTFEKVGSKL